MDELKRLESDLRDNKELADRFEAARKAALEAGAKSDGDAAVSAAKSLGYEISVSMLDRALASAQELSESELALASGGLASGVCSTHQQYDNDNDELDHGNLCLFAWHCYTAILHTECEDKEAACWSDYKCVGIYH